MVCPINLGQVLLSRRLINRCARLLIVNRGTSASQGPHLTTASYIRRLPGIGSSV